MTDVECEHCGELFDKRGIGAHQRHCSGESPDEEESSAQLTDLEQDVLARDDGRCARCDSDSSLVFHTVDPDVERKRTNVVTLCADCEDEVDDLHPRTKRTKIHHDR